MVKKLQNNQSHTKFKVLPAQTSFLFNKKRSAKLLLALKLYRSKKKFFLKKYNILKFATWSSNRKIHKKKINAYRIFLKKKRCSRYRFLNSLKGGSKSKFSHKLKLITKKNNIFCNFSNFLENKTLKSCSSGTYGIKVSKKTAKFSYDAVLNRFNKEVQTRVNPKNRHERISVDTPVTGIFVTVAGSIRIKKKLVQFVRRNFKKRALLINVLHKKAFNGCRAAKKVRKKRRRMRIYK